MRCEADLYTIALISGSPRCSRQGCTSSPCSAPSDTTALFYLLLKIRGPQKKIRASTSVSRQPDGQRCLGWWGDDTARGQQLSGQVDNSCPATSRIAAMRLTWARLHRRFFSGRDSAGLKDGVKRDLFEEADLHIHEDDLSELDHVGHITTTGA